MTSRLHKEVFVYFCVDCGVTVSLLSKLIADNGHYIKFCYTCKCMTNHKPLAIDFEKRQYITIL
jgi:hypothetical protein